jgi:serine/threonine protein kinase
MKCLTADALRFSKDQFATVKALQVAPRNEGRVDEMLIQHGEHVGRRVAVKIMPQAWMRFSHDEFTQFHPEEIEQPWIDIGLVKELNNRQCPFACELLGIYMDDTQFYVVHELATEGDLLSWCETLPRQLPRREEKCRPVALQLCKAVQYLHNTGIAHRDLSLENVVVTQEGTQSSDIAIKVIDFGMASLSRFCSGEGHGKTVYRAPEMYGDARYDAFLSDIFALGCIVFIMCRNSLPWMSTDPISDPRFMCAQVNGIKNFLEDAEEPTDSCIGPPSKKCNEVLGGLMHPHPCRRATVGEECFVHTKRSCVLNMAWLATVG